MSTTPTPVPTGRREDRDGTTYVVFKRTFRAPIADVWAAVTESDRLGRWIGTWAATPRRAIDFRMTAEAEDARRRPGSTTAGATRLALRSVRRDDKAGVALELDLDEPDGVTTLTFAQEVATRRSPRASVRAGTTTSTGWSPPRPGATSRMAWDDYYPAFAAHYRAELA